VQETKFLCTSINNTISASHQQHEKIARQQAEEKEQETEWQHQQQAEVSQ
jgi:hypothetical protein